MKHLNRKANVVKVQYVESNRCVGTTKNGALWIIDGKLERIELPTSIQAPIIAMMAAIIGD